MRLTSSAYETVFGEETALALDEVRLLRPGADKSSSSEESVVSSQLSLIIEPKTSAGSDGRHTAPADCDLDSVI